MGGRGFTSGSVSLSARIADVPSYFLIERDGREARASRAFKARDLRSFKNAPGCLVFVNELTNSIKRVGADCRPKRKRRR